MDKAIHVQVESLHTKKVSNIKSFAWSAITFDNIKIIVHAYEKMNSHPLEDCKIEIMDEKEVFELTGENLMTILRFFIDNFNEKNLVVNFPQKFHHIIPDVLKLYKKPIKHRNL